MLDKSCAEVASTMKIRKAVRSCTIDTRMTPLLLAWRGPLVVMPRRLVDDLGAEHLRGIIAHELAHLVRRDHWANLFVFIVRTLLWWNPVAWWAERELRVAQELCCDAIAIDRSGANRQGYATTLLKALEFIQEEPLASHALASGMGSKVSILRRFKMIGEKRLSYRLSRWTALLLLGMAIPMVCIPVRAQEKKLTVTVKVEIEDNNKNPQTTETKQAKADDNAAEMSPGIDPEIKKLGDDVHKRITTYSDVDTLTIKDGQTGRMKVKKNVTPVAEILITPHFVKNGIKFDLEGADATGKAIDGAKTTLGTVHDAQSERTGLGKTFSIDGEDIFTKIQLTPKRTDDNSVDVEVKVLFTRLPTPAEIDAMLLSSGKDGQLHLNFQKISLRITQHKAAVGDYPKDLKELKMTLPKDVYSPTGEDYHYEAQRNRFILSSCGKDGIYGNDDDEILINSGLMGIRTGQRHELYPLDEEDKEDDKKESVEPRSERCWVNAQKATARSAAKLFRTKLASRSKTHACICSMAKPTPRYSFARPPTVLSSSQTFLPARFRCNCHLAPVIRMPFIIPTTNRATSMCRFCLKTANSVPESCSKPSEPIRFPEKSRTRTERNRKISTTLACWPGLRAMTARNIEAKARTSIERMVHTCSTALTASRFMSW